jgi:hypothetical protein
MFTKGGNVAHCSMVGRNEWDPHSCLIEVDFVLV